MSEWLRGVLHGDPRGPVPRPLVVKLGGSLLRRPAWPNAVERLLATLPTPRLLVVGGGPLVDGLRAIDAAAAGPVELVHRLAIELMGVTARLVATRLALPLVAAPAQDTAVLDAPTWLGHDGRLTRLPVGWHVTSDSIAATVAVEEEAGLLLVKSVAPPSQDAGVIGASAAGWVDPHFAEAAAPLRFIGWAAPAPAG